MFKVNNKELWTYFTPCSGVSIVNFEQVNADWEYLKLQSIDHFNNQIRFFTILHVKQLTFICSKSTIETLEQGVKFV